MLQFPRAVRIFEQIRALGHPQDKTSRPPEGGRDQQMSPFQMLAKCLVSK